MAALALVVGCGQAAVGEFDSAVAEEFIQNKARAEIQNNPALAVQDPRDPEVTCRRDTKADSADATRFECEVRVVSSNGKELGTQLWEALVEFDSASGDSVVRETRLIDSEFEPVPRP
jgi:hypothetical protein